MNNCETTCFAIGAGGACIIFGLEVMNAVAVQLVATIKRNFKELGV